MKTHSGEMTSELKASVVPQSSEGNTKDSMEANPHASSGNQQEDTENIVEKTSEKMSLENLMATVGSADGGQEPKDKA